MARPAFEHWILVDCTLGSGWIRAALTSILSPRVLRPLSMSQRYSDSSVEEKLLEYCFHSELRLDAKGNPASGLPVVRSSLHLASEEDSIEKDKEEGNVCRVLGLWRCCTLIKPSFSAREPGLSINMHRIACFFFLWGREMGVLF